MLAGARCVFPFMFINTKKLKYADLITKIFPTALKEFNEFGSRKFHPWAVTKDAPEVIHNGKWMVRVLYADGRFLFNSPSDYPKTTSLLSKIDQSHLHGVGFSWLRAGAHIYPHTGYIADNRIIRSHLALSVPRPTQDGVIIPEKDCWLRVGGETKTWREGEILIFDDTIEHEAQNNTDKDRVVMIFDFYEDAFTSSV